MNSIGVDRRLDDAGDLDMTSAGAAMVDDVAQAARIRFRFTEGEWYLDTSAGIPYWAVVWGRKAPNLDHVRAVFLDALRLCPGVDSVQRMDVSLDPSTRLLTVVWAASAGGDIGGFEVGVP